VPRELLRIEDASGEFLANYDATELAVWPGEVIQVTEVRHGWMLVTNAEGARGWIPVACAEPD
jgi:SH3 domain-containing protein